MSTTTKQSLLPRTSLTPKSIIRFSGSTIATLGLATIILWGLVSNTDPKAKINNFSLTRVNDDYSTLFFDMQLINDNYFRGFNYTYGWIEIFYVSPDNYWTLNWNYTPVEYQGIRKPIFWNDTLNVTASNLGWPKHTDPLIKHESYIYVSLFLTYWYKILFWTTSTTNYQWLDTRLYLNSNLTIMEPSNLNRMKNFTLGIST